MKYRTYNPETDKQAVNRIWYECGWLEKDDPKPMDALLEEAAVIVADVNGEPECLAMSYLGDMDYLGERLPFSCIAGVTTSLVARRQKLAGRLTATRIALDAAAGAPVSALGMFEQGYYNRLGYGTYGYEHICCITPATLRVDVSPRVPKRLTKGDWKLMHQSRLSRLRVHGSCNCIPPVATRAEASWAKNACGFGYLDDNGDLTHHFWMDGLGKEHGPFEIWWLVFQTRQQFVELLALLKSFGE